MKIPVKVNVLGAARYDITDEKTGEIKVYFSVHAFQAVQAGRGDRIGFEPAKFSATGEVFRQLQSYQFPQEIECEVELRQSGKNTKMNIVNVLPDPSAKIKAAA